MAVVLMPALSPTMTEGKLARWLVKEGDEVRSGDVIAEIETDKAVMEVESLDDGKVSSIAVAAGTEGVLVGTAIAEILGEGEASTIADIPAPTPATTPAPAAPAPEAAAPEAEAPAPAAPATPAAPPASPAPEAPAPQAPAPQAEAPAPATPAPAAPATPAGARILASPLARRMAADKGIDLAAVKGTGPKGRIVKADVEAAAPGTARPAAGERSTLVANSAMRNVIAERLQQSWNSAPHFFLETEIVLDPLLEARKALNAAAPEGVKVSVNDMVIKAAAMALMKHPGVNASWEGTHIRQHHHADIAVAVSIKDGLITPIVRDSEAKGIYAISTEMGDLAARARDGKLAPEEYAGGSFTISNLGMFGITAFTAIINPPHSAILAIGKGVERPVVVDGEIAVATMLTATIACDHRVVDGAAGAVWLAAFKDLVENPVLALG